MVLRTPQKFSTGSGWVDELNTTLYAFAVFRACRVAFVGRSKLGICEAVLLVDRSESTLRAQPDDVQIESQAQEHFFSNRLGDSPPEAGWRAGYLPSARFRAHAPVSVASLALGGSNRGCVDTPRRA